MASSYATPASLPLRSIPGSYGLPVLGPLKDRLDYFWFQGPATFFRDRLLKHKSTVFRTNLPPTFPFFFRTNPNVVALLDTTSFSSLFDLSLVQKDDVLVGDYMPSLSFTGNLRVLAYLDPSEPRHSQVKSFAFDVLKSSSRVWVSSLFSNLETMWTSIDGDIEKSGKSGLILPLQKCIFRFLTQSLVGADPKTRPEVDGTGFAVLDSWLALQLLPTTRVGVLPQPLEELLLHSFPFPFFLVSPGYNKLYKFIEEEGGEVIQKGVRDHGLTKEETIHNLLFVLGFNAFGGFSVFLPNLFSTIGRDKSGLQERLRVEVREKGKSGLSFETVAEMELVKSTVYEVLRMNPPVPMQYARARKDFLLSSHDSSYEIKKGELLCGYQPLAMRDPKVFEDPEVFVADRFVEEGKKKGGGGGKELLNYLFWSNGPETRSPSLSNKQCAAKDYVVATACLIVAWMFTRYDEFTCDDSSLTINRAVKAVASARSVGVL